MAPEIVRLPLSRPESELAELRRAGQHLYGTPVDVWSLGCVAFEVLFGSPLFRCRLGAHASAADAEAELSARIASDEPLRFPEHTRARRRPSPAALDFLSSALARSAALRHNADLLLQHPWIAGEPDPDLLSTSPLPPSSPFSALSHIFSGGRRSTGMASAASAGSSNDWGRADSDFALSGEERAGGGGSGLSAFAAGGPPTSASEGDLQLAGVRWQHRHQAPEPLAWPPRPSPTSTLLFPAFEGDEAAAPLSPMMLPEAVAVRRGSLAGCRVSAGGRSSISSGPLDGGDISAWEALFSKALPPPRRVRSANDNDGNQSWHAGMAVGALLGLFRGRGASGDGPSPPPPAVEPAAALPPGASAPLPVDPTNNNRESSPLGFRSLWSSRSSPASPASGEQPLQPLPASPAAGRPASGFFARVFGAYRR